MKLAYLTLAALAGVLVAVPTSAAPVCSSGQCAAPQVVAPAVAVLQPTFPLYGASYTGGGSDDETKELLRELLNEIKGLRADVATVKQAQPRKVAGPDVFEVLRKNCVACHGSTKPKGDFSLVMSDGKFRALSKPDIKAVLNAIDGKAGEPQMPPAGKTQLTAAEKASVKAALSDGPVEPPAEPIPAGKK